MKRACIIMTLTLALAVAAAAPCLAQDADVAKFTQACNTLEGAPPEACACAAEALATQIPAEDYNALADAWLRGELLMPSDAEAVFGTEMVDAVETAFDNCAP